MKKLIALTALAGLLAAGCASRDKDRGGSYDSTGTSSGTINNRDNNSWSTNSNSSSSSSTGTGTSSSGTSGSTTPGGTP